MSADGEEEITSEGEATAVETEPETEAVAEQEEELQKLNLTVEIKDIGPCRKHVAVTVSEADIDSLRNESIDEFSEQAEVPGFRVGRVPRSLLQKRFKSELADQIKQKVLLQSLEQMSDDNDIDPINQPDIDVESLDIPDSGDFKYEFDVEVRPEFEVPDYTKFEIDRPQGEVSDEEFQAFRAEFLESYSKPVTADRAAAAGDSVVCDVTFTHDGKEIRSANGQALRVRPTLEFQDGAIESFDELMTGAAAGDTRTAEVTISVASPVVEMRDETVQAEFTVTEVRAHEPPELTKEFLDQFNCDSEEELENQIRSTLDRQIEYQQRQSAREQVLTLITESADWELPESLVEQQTENALRREVLEMSQAGFTREQIAARENQIRQDAIENTRQALKEHFVLDRIATQENIECDQSDIETELMMMSIQSGEPMRRIRARMVKSGMLDNMEAQLRERKAVDFILEQAKFNDVERKALVEETATAVAFAICGNMTSSLIDDSTE